MVTMSAVWDRTAEVLRGRGGMLATLAAIMLFLPAAVQNALVAYGGRTPGWVAFTGLTGLVAALVAIWGNLALVAAASDPRVHQPDAVRLGARRLPPMVALSILAVIVFALLTLPLFAIVGPGAASMASMSAGSPPRIALSHGAAVALMTYVFLFAAFAVWVSARFALLAPVVVNERRGLGSFARSVELTRDHTWRIIGVLLLFGVVVLVANVAARAVVGLVARLLLGAAGVNTATFLAGLAGGVVVAGATVVSATFVAQLYRIRSGLESAQGLE